MGTAASELQMLSLLGESRYLIVQLACDTQAWFRGYAPKLSLSGQESRAARVFVRVALCCVALRQARFTHELLPLFPSKVT